MHGGYIGKLLFVDLTERSLHEEDMSAEIYRDFIGGSGLGARILYERMKPGVDPFGTIQHAGLSPGPFDWYSGAREWTVYGRL